MFKKSVIYAIAGLLILFNFIYAEAFFDDKPQIRYKYTFRIEDRRDHRKLYLQRLSSVFTCRDSNDDNFFKLEPFFEIRRNLNADLWQRKELGLEIGRDIFDWLYLGESVQKLWRNEDYQHYKSFKKRDTAELETRLLFSHDLIAKDSFKMMGYILNEYTYDLRDGRATSNEISLGVTFPIHKYIEAGLNWRHIDRIHYYDSDNLEISATLVF
ncbi:MAG: hypothetical protein ABIG46_05690 [Candidatus Omnitrophota bacterium]